MFDLDFRTNFMVLFLCRSCALLPPILLQTSSNWSLITIGITIGSKILWKEPSYWPYWKTNPCICSLQLYKRFFLCLKFLLVSLQMRPLSLWSFLFTAFWAARLTRWHNDRRWDNSFFHQKWFFYLGICIVLPLMSRIPFQYTLFDEGGVLPKLFKCLFDNCFCRWWCYTSLWYLLK